MDFKKTPPICNFNELRKRLFDQLESRKYTAFSIGTYRKTANLLENFIKDNKIEFYNSEVGEAFLSECKLYRGNYQGNKPNQTDIMRTTIKQFDCLLNGVEYKRITATKYFCPNNFSKDLEAYLLYQHGTGKKPITVSKIKSGCSQLFMILEEDGVKTLSQITPDVVYTAMMKFSTPCAFHLFVPQFLKYLYEKKILGADYSNLISTANGSSSLPTVYKKDEIEKLLSVVDRTQIHGKRNYAMLLLAARFGIRVSDIVNLTFDNVDFIAKTIKFVQIKTDTPIKFQMLEEIEIALKDYLSVRPNNTTDNCIFLRCKAPYFPVKTTVIYDAMKKYLKLAKINTTGKKRGAHSLRSSLASALIAENVPYAVTQKILGHNDANTLQHYVRLDIEQLRKCALSVAAPTGSFKYILKTEGARL